MADIAPIHLVVNGSERLVAPAPDRPLLFALRDDLGLTGAKPGCGEGTCGACTVLLDDKPVQACQVRLSEAAGRRVRTVEGLASPNGLHPVQRAFLDAEAFQCGYCTSGMQLQTVALLERDPDPTDEAIREALHGNACRCGTYPRILAAVRRASGLVRDGAGGTDAMDSTPPSPDERASDAWRPRRPWDLTPSAKRDWFDVLGPGLVAVHEPAPPIAGWVTSTSAWLHVAGDGTVTAFTGKVDVGQDNRTALSLIVARGLGVPLDRVRLVMADTDLCPYDQGTFGSRSVRDSGALLATLAEGARARLEALAAEQGLGPDAWAELVGGLRRVEMIADRRERGPGKPRPDAPGRGHVRATGPAIVTGAHRYPSDLSLPEMLHGRVLHPPVKDAVLRAVDVSRAEAIPGVTVVREGGLVGVVAASPALAGRAASAIEASWDRPELPSDEGIVDWLRGHPVEQDEGSGSAVLRDTGDVERAIELAPTYCAATYTTAYLAHVPLETQVALASWDGDRVTVWAGSQIPFLIRRGVAEALGIAEDRVRVIVPDTGGGFGGKHSTEIAEQAARLARAVGRPVKVRWTRGEEFTEGYLRPAAVIDIRSGASADGAITAWDMRNTNSGTFALVGPYRVPNQRHRFQPAESPLSQGSYRGLAATANTFARESHIDELAHELGADPLELRLAHLADDRIAHVLRLVADRIGWAARPKPGEGRGMGIACGVEKEMRVATAVEVEVGPDRGLQVRRIVEAVDCGAIVDARGLENQVLGAIVMGLGAALFERVRIRDGAIANGSFTDYRVPRIDDVPPVEVLLVDRPEVPSAGAGETPILGIAPAIANAVFAATGVRLRSLPLVPDGVVPEG